MCIVNEIIWIKNMFKTKENWWKYNNNTTFLIPLPTHYMLLWFGGSNDNMVTIGHIWINEYEDMLEGTSVAWDEFFPSDQNVNIDGSVVVVWVKLGVLILGLHHIGINGAKKGCFKVCVYIPNSFFFLNYLFSCTIWIYFEQLDVFWFRVLWFWWSSLEGKGNDPKWMKTFQLLVSYCLDCGDGRTCWTSSGGRTCGMFFQCVSIDYCGW
jgi:hypothetical protein